MKPGTRVQMSDALKELLTNNGSTEHVLEFEHCIGTVEGLADYGTQQGPEVSVRWEIDGVPLRYWYHPDYLDVVEEVCDLTDSKS